MQKTFRIRKKREKIYGVFLQTECGKTYGWVEESFNMNWSPIYVRVWNKNNAEAYLKDLLQNKHRSKIVILENDTLVVADESTSLETVNVKYFIARVNSTKSPIKVDMRYKGESKFHRRNKMFQVKPAEVPQYDI